MGITQPAALLFRLQQLDLELDRLQAEKRAIENTLQGDEQLRKLRARYEAAQQQAQAGLQTQQEAEWALEDLNRRLQTQEQRLFSGVVSPKDLQVLQQEVQRLRAQQSRQEEVVLEMIEAAESLQEAAQQELQVLKKAENAREQESATLLERRAQLTTHTQELQTRRDQQASDIPETLLTRYTTLRRTRQGCAVSRVEHNTCQWCRVILTPGELQHVRINTELHTCTNCGRILYYDRT
ncbi:MAG: hypothetical protein J2P37_21875 [Ktedonobacteraceae bacterium]|nr:hypothetical protein [Ktedonobacteraceae bacterium]MBO0794896.1 hypothetical protein [Ktedonobacteraceae bacterium]